MSAKGGNMKKKPEYKRVATLTLHGVGDMTDKQRTALRSWLWLQLVHLHDDWENYSKRFTATYERPVRK